MVDQKGFDTVDAVARLTEKAVARGRYFAAMRLWGQAEDAVLQVADDVDFYNIMSKIPRDKANRIHAAAERGDFRGGCGGGRRHRGI